MREIGKKCLAPVPRRSRRKTLSRLTPLPGPFPGRVMKCATGCVLRPDPGYVIKPAPWKAMMARGNVRVTGAEHQREAWKRLLGVGDVVGIRSTPSGKGRPGTRLHLQQGKFVEVACGFRGRG